VARALHFQASLPVNFYDECVPTTTYLINQMPTKLLNSKTPYEVLLKKKPNYDHIKFLGACVIPIVIAKPVIRLVLGEF